MAWIRISLNVLHFQCGVFTGIIPVFELFLIVFEWYWYWYLKVVFLELDCFRTIVFDCLSEKRRYHYQVLVRPADRGRVLLSSPTEVIDFLEFISASTIAKSLLATLAEQPSEDGLKR